MIIGPLLKFHGTRDILAMSYRTSYRTDLRSESCGRVMSKVLQGCARLVGLGYAPRLRWQ
jgi:hypothetical protein